VGDTVVNPGNPGNPGRMNPTERTSADLFFSGYSQEVYTNALKLRAFVLKNLPGISEQVDEPAKMVAYSYGNKYADVVCVIIPSKKGLKLGFYKGNELPDPDKLLEGTGKISRYVLLNGPAVKLSPALKKLLQLALKAYKIRSGIKK